MFKKPLADLKTSAPLRSSDRRKLKQRISHAFSLDAAAGDLLVPDGLLSIKFSTHLNEPGVAYLSPDGDPLWFSLGKGSDAVLPSVYTLWKKQDLLPFLSTPSSVIPVLINGADLMAPGVVHHSTSLSLDQLVAIVQAPTNGQPKLGPPLAVGQMAVSTDILDRNEHAKGKAVHILHTWKDHLWDMGTKSDPPEPSDLEIESHGSGCTGHGNKQPPTVATPDDTSVEHDASEHDHDIKTTELTPQEVSQLLRGSLIQCIATTLSKSPPSAFLIPATTFYTSYLLPSRSFDATSTSTSPIDIKHSAHKSLAAFLRSCMKEGLIKIKEGKGEIFVTGVNASHEDVETHVPWKTVKDVEERREKKEERERQEGEKRKEKDRELQITQFWKPHLGSTVLFKEAKKDVTAFYTQIELRAVLNEYVASKQLLNSRDQAYINFSTDQVLLNALSDGKTKEIDSLKELEFMRREEVLEKLVGKMQPWYEIRGEGRETILKKGQLKPITIVVKIRQGRRALTLITGFEQFSLDAETLAEDLRKNCACSTSVNSLPGKSAGEEVMVQGKQMQAVVDLLIAKGVPKKWIIELKGK